MKKILLLLVALVFLSSSMLNAQQRSVTGRVVEAGTNQPLPGVTVSVKGGGQNQSTQTNNNGQFVISAPVGATLVFNFIGMTATERAVPASGNLDVTLESSTEALSEVVVTGAMGVMAKRKSFGSSVQSVSAENVAETQRENFVNALQGRVAGLDVISTSGVPGASSSIFLRGISSISGSNQPLIVIDGLPADNSTMHTNLLATSGSTATSFENRGVDFTNRISDFNPEDIASITVLKGPEAAALYGIEAANGAIVITTKRGKAGTATMSYNNSFRVDQVTNVPEVQRVYGLGSGGIAGTASVNYWGPKYEEGTKFYDNVDGFFETALTQKHNLSFEGGSEMATWRISGAYTDQKGVVPNSLYDRINLTGSNRSRINDWLSVDVALNYSLTNNEQPFKGAGGPLLGLLLWPQTDDAKVYLNPDGTRRKYFDLAAEIDNPYFNVEKNGISSKTNRIYATSGITLTPLPWLSFDSKLGFDVSSGENQVLRHPESNYGYTRGGLLDVLINNTRNINLQSFFTVDKEIGKFNANLMVGHALSDRSGWAVATSGEKFMDPNFVSINNSPQASRQSRTTQTDYRLVSAFGQLQMDWEEIVYLTITGRNDWSSTLPYDLNSFFYPSISTAINFTDIPALEGMKNVLSYGKLRASIAQVGRDARPYKIYPALEYKDVTTGGYGYGFTAPNPTLKPEMATSWEIGTELFFLDDRFGVEFSYYKKETKDQIVNDVRASYGTGFILTDMNGGHTRNQGVEVSLTLKPIVRPDFNWTSRINFARSRSELVSLPADLPESYNSDTWLYGNVRNGTRPGQPITSFTGFFYLRNDQGDILISPTSGLPLRASAFIGNGTNRWPKWTAGFSNELRYKNFSMNFLVDFRYGGDVLNATEHYLTARGLSMRTLDRDQPRIVEGVLQDGLENTANPTRNTMVLTPQYSNAYYTGISEELFIERDVNWIRMKDITVNYRLPQSLLQRQNFFKSASVFVTATDLFLITNYSGLDPIVNGNTAAVGGSGGMGIDYGNFPMPTGINFGVRVGL